MQIGLWNDMMAGGNSHTLDDEVPQPAELGQATTTDTSCIGSPARLGGGLADLGGSGRNANEHLDARSWHRKSGQQKSLLLVPCDPTLNT